MPENCAGCRYWFLAIGRQHSPGMAFTQMVIEMLEEGLQRRDR